MGKTIDTSELLYRMGKYAEIDAEQDKHDAFMHFMLLLTRTIEKMPNAALTHKNPIDDKQRLVARKEAESVLQTVSNADES